VSIEIHDEHNTVTKERSSESGVRQMQRNIAQPLRVLFVKAKLNYAGELGNSSRSLSLLLKAYAFNLVKPAWPMETLWDQVTYRRASVLLVPKCRRKASNTLPLKTSNTVDGRHAFVCLPHFFSRLLITQREIILPCTK
jgi:hypothetical protein